MSQSLSARHLSERTSMSGRSVRCEPIFVCSSLVRENQHVRQKWANLCLLVIGQREPTCPAEVYAVSQSLSARHWSERTNRAAPGSRSQSRCKNVDTCSTTCKNVYTCSTTCKNVDTCSTICKNVDTCSTTMPNLPLETLAHCPRYQASLLLRFVSPLIMT